MTNENPWKTQTIKRVYLNDVEQEELECLGEVKTPMQLEHARNLIKGAADHFHQTYRIEYTDGTFEFSV